jgi:hypothetical protein
MVLVFEQVQHKDMKLSSTTPGKVRHPSEFQHCQMFEIPLSLIA